MTPLYKVHVQPNVSQEDELSQQALNPVLKTTMANKVELLCSSGQAE